MRVLQSRRQFLRTSAAAAGVTAALGRFSPLLYSRTAQGQELAIWEPYPLERLRRYVVDYFLAEGDQRVAAFIEAHCPPDIFRASRDYYASMEDQRRIFTTLFRVFYNGPEFAEALLRANTVSWGAARFPADAASLVNEYQVAEDRPRLPVYEVSVATIGMGNAVTTIRISNVEALAVAAEFGREAWAKAARDLLEAAIEDSAADAATRLGLVGLGHKLMAARLAAIAGAAGVRLAFADRVPANSYLALLKLMASGFVPLGEIRGQFQVIRP